MQSTKTVRNDKKTVEYHVTFTDLGVFKRDEEAVQLVLKGSHDFDAFHASYNPVQPVFAQQVESSNGRVGYIILTG